MTRQPPAGTDLQHAIGAYNALMDKVIIPESQYGTKLDDPEKELYLGSIVERAAARRREEQAGGT